MGRGVSGCNYLPGFLALRGNMSLLPLILMLAGAGEPLLLSFTLKNLETLGASIFFIGLSMRCKRC